MMMNDDETYTAQDDDLDDVSEGLGFGAYDRHHGRRHKPVCTSKTRGLSTGRPSEEVQIYPKP